MQLAWLVPALPFAAFALIGIAVALRAPRRAAERAGHGGAHRTDGLAEPASLLALLAVGASGVISYWIFFQLLGGAPPYEAEIPWLALSLETALTFGIRVDTLSALMMVVVTTVSFLVQFYSRGYLWEPEEAAEAGVGHPEVDPAHDETASVEGADRHGAVAHGAAAHPGARVEHHGPPPPLERDPGYARYFAFISLFTGAMLGLVLANNLLVMYLFWEGVGLGSYLLIGFWYNRVRPAGLRTDPVSGAVLRDPATGRPLPYLGGPADAAKKAFVTTRFGDFGFLVGILYLWWQTGTLEFGRLAELAEAGAISETVLTVGALLVFMGAVGKSAQFPLHVWLPDAMEGPTPVSALIHAATMVAAGVYLVARAFPIFEHAPAAMLTVAFIGGFTAIFAASLGLVATDIKRVMAFSTVSQLGYMMLGLGAGSLGAGTFHLFTHAFFKALLFLTAGSVIFSLHRAAAHDPSDIDPRDPPRAQDLRYMGGMWSRTPVTAWTMVIAALSLAGIPPLAGFWSKDEVLLATYERATHGGGAIYWLLLAFAVITVLMTAFYMFRVVFMTFAGEYRGPADPQYIREAPWTMTLPLLLLAVPSILVGLWGAPQLGNPFGQFLEGAEFHVAPMNLTLAALSTVLALAGIGLAWWLHKGGTLLSLAMQESSDPTLMAQRRHPNPIYNVLLNRYWIDELYRWLIDKLIIAVSFGLDLFDRNVVDGVVNGVARGTGTLGNGVRQLQTGRIPAYALAVFAGLAVIAFWAVVVRGAIQ